MEPAVAQSSTRHDSVFDGAGGVRLHRRSWRPATPRAVLLIVHGYGEHSGRYEHLGQWFAARGFAVHAYDQRGHGRSGGHPCHVDRFAEFLDDLARMLVVVREEEPGRPIFLVGHSMGGLITCSFLRERRPDVLGAILSGPALGLVDDFPAWRKWAARVGRRIVPRLSLPSGLDSSAISRDPEVVRLYREDPLVHSTMTSSFAIELLEAVGRTCGGAADVRVPVQILHGEADRLCPLEASRSFHAELTTAGSQLRTYPGLYHEIFNEPERETVFADMLTWLEDRLER